MIPRARLLAFTPEEDAQYTRQITLQQHRLMTAPDALDLYSCHSQPHVLEVMEQCELLLSALSPWLRSCLPGTPPQWMYDHLLLAAKLHDVGMCGTEAHRALLEAADRLFTLLSAPGGAPAALLAPYLCALLTQGQTAGLTTRAWRDVRCWAEDAPRHRPQLLHALSEYHEEVKQAIRRQHAENSGRFILTHADALAAHYGAEVDLLTVAALAALHSGSSLPDACIVPEGPDHERIRQYVHALVSEYRGKAEADRITGDGPFRRVVMLSALLRLADTRRSGSRLMSMDQTRLLCEVDATGQIGLYRLNGSLREAIPMRAAFEILASEALTEFGAVRAYPVSDGTWHICHEITLRNAGSPEIRNLFARSRLRTYAEELDTGALVCRLGFTHEIRLHMEGCPPFAAASAIKRWRTDVPWIKDSSLKIALW